MKRIYSILCAAAVVVAVSQQASAQKEETRPVSGFNSIASSGSFEVQVKIDGSESLKLVGNEADLKQVETVVENGKLQIRNKDRHGWWGDSHHGKIEVYITARSLSGLTVAGSGSIRVEGSLNGDVTLTVSGSGGINTSLKADNTNIVLSGSGGLKLNGSTNDTNITISGSGNVSARDLKANSVNVSIAGSGNVNIDAEKSITAHLVGSGSLNYTGNASVRDIRTVGSGRVSKNE